MKECEWKRVDKTILPQSSISSILYRGSVTAHDLLTEILADRIYGFAIVDIVPTDDAKKFIELKWLPIIKHDEIYYNDLPAFMQDDWIKKTFPRKTLVQTMHAKNILLHTRLIQWYVLILNILIF